MSLPVVLSDFDGTLARRDGMWRGALADALDRVAPGSRVDRDAFRAGLRDGFPWHTPEKEHRHLRTADRWWTALHPLFVRAYLGAGVAASTADAAANLVRETFPDVRRWSVFDDVRTALGELRAHGWRSVVVSNHVPELPELVAELGLTDLIDDVVTSAATGYEKPHPEMFRIALACCGRPDRVWMIGDNPTADVAGAEAVGVPALLVRTPGVDGRSRGLPEAVARVLQ